MYLLRKALYGLKQAPRAWYSRINEYLSSLGYLRSPNEHTLYVRNVEGELIIVSLYVDDLLIIGSNPSKVDEFKEAMNCEFEMTDLGIMSYFLGMEINQTSSGIFVNQRRYAVDVLKRFGMDKCKPVNTPLVAT